MTKDKKLICHPENNLDTRVALLEQALKDNIYALRSFDAKFDRLEAKMDKRFDDVNSEIKEIRKEASSNFKWLLGTIFAMGTFFTGGLIGLGTIMAHGFHWF